MARRAFVAIAALAAAVTAAAGCDSGSPAADAAAGDPDGALLADGAPAADGPAGAPDATADAPAPTADAAPAADSPPLGTECGGFLGPTCGADQYCDFPANTCSAADETGTCQPRPLGCPDLFEPVCACNGMVYSNSCDAAAAGFDVSSWGGCTPPPGMFSCGQYFCDQGNAYCEHFIPGVPGGPHGFTCKSLPAPCTTGDPTCTCLSSEPCSDMCTESPSGDFTLTCLGV